MTYIISFRISIEIECIPTARIGKNIIFYNITLTPIHFKSTTVYCISSSNIDTIE